MKRGYRYAAHTDKQKESRKIYAEGRSKLFRSGACEICLDFPLKYDSDGEIECKTFVLCGHHEDYSKPLDVIFICPSCHAFIHNCSQDLGEYLYSLARFTSIGDELARDSDPEGFDALFGRDFDLFRFIWYVGPS